MKARKLLALLTIAAVALGLSGCVVFTGPITGIQLDVIGNVRVSFTICASGSESADPMDTETHPGCPDEGNSEFAASRGAQVLLAFRVPAGTTGPATFTSSGGEPLTFRPSPSYVQQLTTFVPPPAGFEWLGYISDPFAFDDGADGTPAKSASFDVDFDLPPATAGAPFVGPFKIRPVVGARSADPADPNESTRPVSCGSNVFGGAGAPVGSNTDCIDSPSRDDTENTNIEISTRDLGIGGPPLSVPSGSSATVPVTATYSGAAPGAPFALTAASTVPGATVGAPTPGSFTPSPGGVDSISVPITVPESTPPGAYDLAVRAALANGQSRTGVVSLTVSDGTDPVARALAVKPKTFTPTPSTAPIAAARQPRVSYRLTEVATMRFTVRRCRGKRCKKLKGSFRHAGKAGRNSFRFTGFLRNKPLRAGSYKLVGVPTDAAKNRGKSVSASFTTRRAG